MMNGLCLITNNGMSVVSNSESPHIRSRFVVSCRPVESDRNSFAASAFNSMEADFPKEHLMNQLYKWAIFILGLALSLTGAIEAQETSTHTTPQGNSLTDTRSLQDGQYTNDKTVTAPNGQTYTNDKTMSHNGSGQVVSQDTQNGPNGRSATATDTRSLENGQYTNDKTVTGPNGKTYTNDKTTSLNSNGHPVTTDTMTGPNGKSASSTTTYGRHGSKTAVTGPNGRTGTGYRLRR
jgi:hypothetical protein